MTGSETHHQLRKSKMQAQKSMMTCWQKENARESEYLGKLNEEPNIVRQPDEQPPQNVSPPHE